METLTIKINTRINKGKQLFGLIKELAKEGAVEIQKTETVKTALKEMKAVKTKPINKLDDRTPGASLLKSMEEAKTGKTKEMKNIEDYFKNLRKRANV